MPPDNVERYIEDIYKRSEDTASEYAGAKTRRNEHLLNKVFSIINEEQEAYERGWYIVDALIKQSTKEVPNE